MAWGRTPKPGTTDSSTGKESKDEAPRTTAADLYCPKCAVWYRRNDTSHEGH